MIEFKLIGDWRKYRRVMGTVPIIVKAAAIAGQRKAAERLVKIVKDHINKQDLGWAARAEGTAINDPRILVDYGEYLHNIKSWRDNDIYYAGVKSTAYNHKGVKISDIASYHEFGSPTEPARPLWGPAMGELGGSRGVRKIVIESIYTKLKILESQGYEVFFEL